MHSLAIATRLFTRAERSGGSPHTLLAECRACLAASWDLPTLTGACTMPSARAARPSPVKGASSAGCTGPRILSAARLCMQQHVAPVSDSAVTALPPMRS